MYTYKDIKKGLFKGKLYFLNSFNALPLSGSSSLLRLFTDYVATLMECIVVVIQLKHCCGDTAVWAPQELKEKGKFICKDLKEWIKRMDSGIPFSAYASFLVKKEISSLVWQVNRTSFLDWKTKQNKNTNKLSKDHSCPG